MYVCYLCMLILFGPAMKDLFDSETCVVVSKRPKQRKKKQVAPQCCLNYLIAYILTSVHNISKISKAALFMYYNG